jgi:hypothetical protein
MLINLLKEFVEQKRAAHWPDFVIINGLKEYLQLPVLSFIYSQKEYQNFIFTGGSALHIIHKLPRLSENLNFNLKTKDYQRLDLNKLGEELKKYFKNDFVLDLSFRVTGTKTPGASRLYLKFPVLYELGLANSDESDFLFVKIEPDVENFKTPEYEINPVSGFGFNFLVKNYSLKFLMIGKIDAILHRTWFKGKNNEINIKGRDYYDLYWYLEKSVNIEPAILKSRFGFKNEQEFKAALLKKINTEVTERKLLYDLENFFPEQTFIKNFCHNYQKIMERYLK